MLGIARSCRSEKGRAGRGLAGGARLCVLVYTSLLAACPAPEIVDEGTFAYRERVIAAEREARLPLLIALHGLGSTPEQLLALFDGFDVPVRVIAPRAPDPYEIGSSWFPIDDPLRAPRVIRARAWQLSRWFERIRAQRPSRGRTIVTGFSQGGALSFTLAAYHSERLAAALPLAGFLPAGGPRVRSGPAFFRVFALHGSDDPRIPFADGAASVARLREAGIQATMIPFPGVGHAIPPAMTERFYALLREQLARASALD